MHITIEVCIDSVESAIAAVRGGANRLELCGNLGLGGGTTPSLGLFKAVRNACPTTPIMVMIRPRPGDFLYTKSEFEVMIADILVFKEAGADGVVFGVLTAEGYVDVERASRLVGDAFPMQVCFHRAFDMTCEPSDDQLPNLQRIISIPGITRVLTSGCGKTAPSSLSTLKKLMQRTTTHIRNAERNSPLVILPGSGINPITVAPLLEELLPWGLQEIHLSGGSWVPSEMVFKHEGMGMGVGGEGEWSIWRTNEDTIRQVRQIVDNATSS